MKTVSPSLSPKTMAMKTTFQPHIGLELKDILNHAHIQPIIEEQLEGAMDHYVKHMDNPHVIARRKYKEKSIDVQYDFSNMRQHITNDAKYGVAVIDVYFNLTLNKEKS